MMARRLRRWLLLGCTLWLCCTVWTTAAMPPAEVSPEAPPEAEAPSRSPMAVAFEQALSAAEMAQAADTPETWGAVAAAWTQAIQTLQQVPADAPQRVFAQRKAREYLRNLQVAQRQAETTAPPRVFPTLGSPVLDEQLGVYLSYLAVFGPPDVLAVGSSRVLQGVDPQGLQRALRDRNLPDARVYTFGVNGATAQMVSFIVRQLLTPEQLPRLIIWAGGSRAFNSGRSDRTWAAVLNSPGYQALRAGARPRFDWSAEKLDDLPPAAARAASLPVTDINGYGFRAVETVFNPATYYQRYPRVSGQYDSAYQPFRLTGVQSVSLEAITTFARSRDIPLVFVNLPLSDDYLDATRLQYERQFQRFLRTQAAAGDFILLDWLEQWRGQNAFFADPSHLNQQGAARIASQLANASDIPWQRLQTTEAEATEAAK